MLTPSIIRRALNPVTGLALDWIDAPSKSGAYPDRCVFCLHLRHPVDEGWTLGTRRRLTTETLPPRVSVGPWLMARRPRGGQGMPDVHDWRRSFGAITDQASQSHRCQRHSHLGATGQRDEAAEARLLRRCRSDRRGRGAATGLRLAGEGRDRRA